jgi:hypothetical protein
MGVIASGASGEFVRMFQSPEFMTKEMTAKASTTWLAALLIYFIMTLAISGSTLFVYGEAYAGNTPTARAVARKGLILFPKIFLLTILTTVLTAIGGAFCYLPGIALSTMWYVAQPALVIEGRRVIRAMSRSFNLVQGDFWRVLGVYFMANMINGIFVYVLVVPTTLLAFGFGAVSPSVEMSIALGFILFGLTAAIVAPFTGAFTVATYIDLRVRREALDIEVMMSQLPPVEATTTEPAGSSDPFGLG